MKSIKLICLLLISILVISSCRPIDSSTEIETKERQTIEFWYGLTGQQGKIMEAFIKDFNESQTEIKVIGVSQESYQVTSKALKSSIVKKQVPSVVLLEDSDMKELANKNALMDLTKFINGAKGFDVNDFSDLFMSQGVIENKVYALPIYGTTQVIYYRKDLFEKNNISPNVLNTWEGLEEAAKQLTKLSNEEVLIYGFEPMQGRENIIDAAINRGGRFVSADGKTILINDKAWKYTFEKFRSWIHDDQIMKVNYGGEGWQYWYATIDDVMQGKAAGYFGSVADNADLDFNMVAAHTRPHWLGFDDYPTGVLNAHTICIPNGVTGEEAKAAFEWMNYITSTEVTAAWSMETGYIPVRESAYELEVYKTFMNANEEFLVTRKQMEESTKVLFDPTGGKIYEALKNASVQVEVFNEDVDMLLDQLAIELQEELDRINNQ